MNEKRDASTGCLYRFDTDFKLTAMVPGIMISNGLAWSPDSRTMYHSDTPAGKISAWDFEPQSGAISNQRLFAESNRPDGAAVDREGCYWSAVYGGGKVVRFSPRGELIAEYTLPALCPTMCAFGGPDLVALAIHAVGDGRIVVLHGSDLAPRLHHALRQRLLQRRLRTAGEGARQR